MDVFAKRQRLVDESLLLAIRANNVSAARQALDKGASPNAREMRLTRPNLKTKDPGGKLYARTSALLLAIRYGGVPMVQLLLERGANPNLSIDETTPLIASLSSEGATILKLLLRYGANANGEKGDSAPLAVAANHGDIACMEALLKAGADINGGSTGTPLMWAVGTPDNAKVLWLLRHGADINFKLRGSTALDSAEVGSETWKILRARGAKGLSIEQRKREDKENTLYFEKQNKEVQAREKKFLSSLPQKDTFWRAEDDVLLRVFLLDFARVARKEKFAWPEGDRVGIYPMAAGMSRGGWGGYGVFGDDIEADRKQLEITLDMEASGLVRNQTPLRVPRSVLPNGKYYFRKASEPLYELVPPEGTFLSVSLSLPGYSKDYQRAVLNFSFTPTPHGASAVYFFKKVQGAWTVAWRDYCFYV